ncbi:MAG: hypothetical protein QXM43_05890 [Desulfurococcaceae archaeon]
MVRCPFCGLESSLEDFKMLRESWKYGFYEVRRLECPKCKGVFNYYEGTSPRGRHMVFVVKVRPRR